MMNIIHNLYNKGFFHLLSVNFLIQFLGFGSLLLVARFLTPVEFGEIKIIQSYEAIFLLLAGFGFNTAVLKFCSEKRNVLEKKYILNYAFKRTLAVSFFTLIMLTVLVLFNIITPSREIASWLLVYSVSIPFAALTTLLIAYLQALKEINEMAGAQALVKFLSVIIIVIGTWIWGFPGFIFSTILAYIAGLISLMRNVSFSFLQIKIGLVPTGFAYAALWSMLANSASMIGTYSDMILLDHFSHDRADIGFYSLASIFVLGAQQVTATIQTIATPYFSEYGHDERWFRNKLFQIQTRTALLSIFIAISLFGVARVLVFLFYSAEYQQTLMYLVILLLKYIVWSSYALIGASLVGIGLMKYNFAVVSISTPIGIISSYLLLKSHGILGVAWGQFLTSCITFMLVLFLSRVALHKYFTNQCSSVVLEDLT